MNPSKSTVVVDRPLTEDELDLLMWLVDKSRAKNELLTQIDGIRVVGECGCGCDSFDLEVRGDSAVPAKMNGHVSFAYDRVGEDFCDGFLWVNRGFLEEIELSVIGEKDGPCRLPRPEEIEEFEVW